MTDSKQRNITPGKGDIYTFMDCEHRDKHFFSYMCFHPIAEYTYCAVYDGMCPQGFPRPRGCAR